MKSLTEYLNESILESADVSKFERLIDSTATQRKIMKDSGFDEDVVPYALSYIEGSIDAMVDEHGDEWMKAMSDWIAGDFAEVFAEYYMDEINPDRDPSLMDEDLSSLVSAIQKHLDLK